MQYKRTHIFILVFSIWFEHSLDTIPEKNYLDFFDELTLSCDYTSNFCCNSDDTYKEIYNYRYIHTQA